MFDFLYGEIQWQTLMVLISVFAGWYFFSSLYGRMPGTKSLWGNAYDNPLHFVLYTLLGRREPPTIVSWPLFLVHVLLMLACAMYCVFGIFLAIDIEVMLWYYLILPYCAACFIRWFFTKKREL